MAVVTEAKPGNDGRVRNVKIKYKNCQIGEIQKPSKYTIVDRSVHNLVLILPVEEQWDIGGGSVLGIVNMYIRDKR